MSFDPKHATVQVDRDVYAQFKQWCALRGMRTKPMMGYALAFFMRSHVGLRMNVDTDMLKHDGMLDDLPEPE